MSSTETMDQRPMGERRRRRMTERSSSDALPPPLTRREMRARGIPLTTEVPVVEEPPDWPARSGAAAAADRTSATRATARRVLSANEETATGEFRAVPEPGAVEPAVVPEPEEQPAVEEEPEPEASAEPVIEPEPEEDTAGGGEAVAAPSVDEGPAAVAPPSRRARRAAARAAAKAAAETEALPATAGAGGEAREPEAPGSAEGESVGTVDTRGAEEPAASQVPEPPAPASAPSRRALREKRRDAGAIPAESTAERSSTGRRPVVRTPLTARGVRTVDATGAISAVQPAVAPSGALAAPPGPAAPVAWAPVAESKAVPPQPEVPPVTEWTTSPSSWESAVSMPAVVLGIEDSPEPPTAGGPIIPPRTTPPRPDRQSVKGVPSPAPAEPTPEHSREASGESGAAAPEDGADTPSAESPAEPAAVAPPDDDLLEPAVRRAAESMGTAPLTRRAARAGEAPGARGLPGRLGRLGRSSTPDATAAWPSLVDEQEAAAQKEEAPSSAAAPTRRSRAEAASRAAGAHEDETAEAPFSGVLKVIVLVAVGLAIGALIYMIASGTLGSLFAEGGAGGATAAGLLLAVPRDLSRSTKEFRDR